MLLKTSLSWKIKLSNFYELSTIVNLIMLLQVFSVTVINSASSSVLFHHATFLHNELLFSSTKYNWVSDTISNLYWHAYHFTKREERKDQVKAENLMGIISKMTFGFSWAFPSIFQFETLCKL